MSSETPSPAQLDAVVAELREIKRSNNVVEQYLRAVNLRDDTASKRAMDTFLRQLLKEPRYADPRRLEHYAFKVFSENGEDGTLQEIFRRIGSTNKRFVEFGVSAGNQCNTHFLLYLGWSGLWMEANVDCINFIKRTFSAALDQGVVALRHTLVTTENINDLIASAGMSGEIDLLSVDIDSNDWHVCKAIQVVIPRVIVIEYNGSFPPPVEWIMPLNHPSPGGMCFGASLSAMEKMLSQKGYSLVGTDIAGVNAFFVRSDLIEGRFAQVGDVGALYNLPRYGLGAGFPTGHQAHAAWTPSFRPLAGIVPGAKP